MAHKQTLLPLTREEILALDSMIRDGAASRYPLSPTEKLALSIWNGATRDIRERVWIERLRDIPTRALTEIEAWFRREERTR